MASPEDAKKILEEISKLPPKERIEALAQFEAKQKKDREEEKKRSEEAEKKQKQDTEALLKKSIDEIASQEEEESKLQKKEEKKENLDEIVGVEKKKEAEQNQQAYQTQQQYAQKLAQAPSYALFREAAGLQQASEDRGYLRPNEVERRDQIAEAMYLKRKSEYNPDERSRAFMNKTEEALERTKSYK